MDKLDFLDVYFKSGLNKIQLIFNDGSFIQNNTISVNKSDVSLEELLGYYVPKYEKGGVFDNRGIEEQIQDPDILPLKVRQVFMDPENWNLGMRTKDLPDLQELTPLPVATDRKTGQSLILDSSHTIVNILNGLDRGRFRETYIEVVSIVGEGLEEIISDFKILKRSSSST